MDPDLLKGQLDPWHQSDQSDQSVQLDPEDPDQLKLDQSAPEDP